MRELADLEVHVLVTARDLGRQLMSSWQEEVKNGRSTSFAEYESDVMGQLRARETDGLSRPTDLRGAFWRFQDVAGALERWGRGLDPQHVHVVVAPPSGSPPDLLWSRFAEAVGFDPEQVPATGSGGPRNETLGMEQVAVLRRVNATLDGRITHPDYGRVVKRRFAQRQLAAHRGTRPQCPADVVGELRAFADGVNDTIRSRGYQVHGDLQELLPLPPEEPAPHPDAVTADDEAEILARVVAESLVRESRRGGGRPPTPPRPAGLKSRVAAALPARFRAFLRRHTPD
jgi:hypothetical protein